MQYFQNGDTNNNVLLEQQKILEEKKRERNKKIKRIFRKVLPFIITFIIISAIVVSIVFLCKYYKKELMDTQSYDMFDIKIDNDELYYSYLWKDSKLERKVVYKSDLYSKIYISDTDKNYVVVEDWGRKGEVKKKKITRYYFTKKKYNELVEKFKWEKETN